MWSTKLTHIDQRWGLFLVTICHSNHIVVKNSHLHELSQMRFLPLILEGHSHVDSPLRVNDFDEGNWRWLKSDQWHASKRSATHFHRVAWPWDCESLSWSLALEGVMRSSCMCWMGPSSDIVGELQLKRTEWQEDRAARGQSGKGTERQLRTEWQESGGTQGQSYAKSTHCTAASLLCVQMSSVIRQNTKQDTVT